MIFIDIDSSQLLQSPTGRGIAAVGHKILRQFLAHFYCVKYLLHYSLSVIKRITCLSLHSAVSVMCKY